MARGRADYVRMRTRLRAHAHKPACACAQAGVRTGRSQAHHLSVLEKLLDYVTGGGAGLDDVTGEGIP